MGNLNENHLELVLRGEHYRLLQIEVPQGVVFALRERGTATGGLDIAIASEIPPESGLSSSAALELALVTAIDHLLAVRPPTGTVVASVAVIEIYGTEYEVGH